MDHKVKKLFPKEISHHSKMFIEVIESTVNLLSDLKSLIPKLISLGVRHIAYKIKPAYFESLTKALIQTISEVLAEDLNEEIKSAWRTAFEMIKMVMMMAMQKQQLTKGNQNFSRMTALLLAMSRHPSLEDSMEVSFDENYWRFWKAISTMEEDFSQSILHSDSIVRERVLNIYEAYIAKDCPNPIRISSEIRKEISNRVTNYFTASELLSVFDDAVDDIQLHLEDSAFPEFRSSVIEDVMKTWETIKGSLGQDQFGELLFKNFFKLVPEVENLFRNEISKHSTMVAGMLDLAIKSMQELAEIIPYLFHLGERHKSYGATPEYMKGFCDAFIFTLEEVLKDEFNSGISNSWNVLFLLISEIMLMGSKSITTDHSSSDIRESKSNSIDRDSRYSPKIENEKTRKSSRSVKRMLTRRKTWSSPDSMDLFKPASPAADRCIIS